MEDSEFLRRLRDPELRAADEAVAVAAGHISGIFGSVDKAKAIVAYERAVAHDPSLSHAWLQLGGLHGQVGHYDASKHAFEKALATAANAREEGVALWGLGLAASDRKDPTAAEDFFARAAKRLAGIDEETETRVRCAKNIASIKYARGDSDAQDAMLSARALAAANNLPEIELRCSHELIGLAKSRSREDDEARFLQDALVLETRLDRKKDQARSHQLLRALAGKRHDKAAQRLHGKQALSLFRELGNQQGIAVELYLLGVMARDDDEMERAYEMFAECLSIAEPIGLVRLVTDSLNKLGDLDYRRDRLDDAERWLNRALSISNETGDAQAQAIALYTLGCVAEDRGDHREKTANWTKALQRAQTAGDTAMAQNIDRLLRG
jgi:tetratricopeptide (TPR) repeat protein